jgi:menaquinone-9 beta-reductase
VIISGAGVAGASLATLLARAGLRVLLLERDRQFRDRIRGEWIAPWGVAEAHRIGLSDVLAAAGATPLPALAGRSGKPHYAATPEGDVALTFFHPILQEELVRAAQAAGAEVIRGARVTAVGGGRTAHATFELEGREHRASARLLVGADGRSSLARKALGQAEETHRRARLLAGVRLGGLKGDPGIGYFLINEDAGGHASVFPQGEGYARAYVFTEGTDASDFRGEAGFRRFIEAAIRLGVPDEVLASAEQAGPLAAFVTDDSWVAHAAGESMVLIGDAAGITDPTWGMGLALAFRDARAVSEALAGNEDWAAAGEAYARERAQYFGAVLTAEDWQSELQFTHGEQARRRRKHAIRLWSKDPSRALDLPGLGPKVDVSSEARRRFFGEDVPMEEESASGAAAGAGEAVAVA